MFRWTYIEEINGWRFYEPDGEYAKGWKRFTMADGEEIVHWSYFDEETGKLTVGWKECIEQIGNHATHHWSYFGLNGYMRTGWQYFTDVDGEREPHWKHFDNKGHLTIGFYDDGQLHFLDDAGRMLTGWQIINGFKYYFNTRGWGYRNGFCKVKMKGVDRLLYFNRDARLVKKIKLNYKGKTFYHSFENIHNDIEGVKEWHT